jgi:hypothetical protein
MAALRAVSTAGPFGRETSGGKVRYKAGEAMRPTTSFLGLVALCACSVSLPIPQPEVIDGSRSGVLVLSANGAPFAVLGIDLSQVDPVRTRTFRLSDVFEAHLVYYRCSLERLGLKEGELELDPDPTPELHLPPPVAERTVRVTSAGVEPWRPLALNEARPPRVDMALRRLPLKPRNVCRSRAARFEPTKVDLPDQPGSWPTFSVRLGDGSALVGAREGQAYRIAPAGAVEVSRPLGERGLLAAHPLEGGELLLMDDRGELHRGTLGGPFEVLPGRLRLAATETATITRLPLVKLVGSRDGRELYAATDARLFAVYADGAWKEPDQAAPPRPRDYFLPQALWLRSGDVLFSNLNDDGRGLQRFSGGGVREEPGLGRTNVTAIALVPGLGQIVGTETGEVRRLTEGGWPVLRNAEPLGLIRAMEPLSRGSFLYSGSIAGTLDFFVGQYFDDEGLCGPDLLFPGRVVLSLTPLGESEFLAVTIPLTLCEDFGICPPGTFAADILRQTEPPERCGP